MDPLTTTFKVEASEDREFWYHCAAFASLDDARDWLLKGMKKWFNSQPPHYRIVKYTSEVVYDSLEKIHEGKNFSVANESASVVEAPHPSKNP